ncbi:MAG: hypothetical protein A2W05_02770 [Candidatus Schekmanbacteria bacterium RBG_16_38_10]|uniref:Uncharacterized protein n=1 Tax=Candidatus Schekmanbacteria bacterium RBG_16_38_10 TaxID=1817879 RepID=A0A1F7RSV0_9BACT|nr:MAG: hypothetical protein A2W05_02770 [Candidatus Schekmanbacteria bacterium RBG_16_38_10]
MNKIFFKIPVLLTLSVFTFFNFNYAIGESNKQNKLKYFLGAYKVHMNLAKGTMSFRQIKKGKKISYKSELASSVTLSGYASWDSINKKLTGNLTLTNNGVAELKNVDIRVYWFNNPADKVKVEKYDGRIGKYPYLSYGNIPAGGSATRNLTILDPQVVSFNFAISVWKDVPNVDIPDNLCGSPGETVAIPININDGSSFAAIDLTVNCTPVNFTDAQTTGWTIVDKPSAGSIKISGAGVALTNGSGIITLSGIISPLASGSYPITVSSSKMYDGQTNEIQSPTISGGTLTVPCSP